MNAVIKGLRSVSDIGMPDFDGYQLIQKIRALGNTEARNIPAIALTVRAGRRPPPGAARRLPDASLEARRRANWSRE
jgi:CheY-like chemotaxis protein